jgi:hypothetical protein
MAQQESGENTRAEPRPDAQDPEETPGGIRRPEPNKPDPNREPNPPETEDPEAD